MIPREIRDLIYGYCLLHDGEIIPYPNYDEKEQIIESGKKPAKTCFGRIGTEKDLQSCAGIVYAADWPSVALLAVNKVIQEEAAVILFGQNVWRLSFVEFLGMGDEEVLWDKHQSHFRHITTHISETDAGHLLMSGFDAGYSLYDIKAARSCAYLSDAFEVDTWIDEEGVRYLGTNIDIKVVGLDDSEKKIFMDSWVLEVE